MERYCLETIPAASINRDRQRIRLAESLERALRLIHRWSTMILEVLEASLSVSPPCPVFISYGLRIYVTVFVILLIIRGARPTPG